MVVTKIQNIIDEAKREKGDFMLAMLWRDSANIDKWSLVVSSEWTNSMSEHIVFNYFAHKLQTSLSKDELMLVSRITKLDTNDRIIKTLSEGVSFSGSGTRVSKTYVGRLYVEDAVFFALGKSKKKAPLRNIQINRNINPNLNRNINPNFNRNINPNFNRNLNPIFNRNLNPIFNREINPIFNHNLNPRFNRNFDGFYLFDLNQNAIEYAILYGNFIIFYNFSNNISKYGIKSATNGYILFDYNQRTNIGRLESDSETGYNFFDMNNNWVGHLK